MSDKELKLHKINEFLARTGLSKSTTYREISAGKLKVTHIGRSMRISEAEICRYIKEAEGNSYIV
jgi:excisionase family DNA binding protein